MYRETTLIIFKMRTQIRINKNKVTQIKKILEKEIFFFFQINSFSSEKFKQLNLDFSKENLELYKIKGTLAQKVIGFCGLKNLLNLVEGPVFLVSFKTPTPNYSLNNIIITLGAVFIMIGIAKKYRSNYENIIRLHLFLTIGFIYSAYIFRDHDVIVALRVTMERLLMSSSGFYLYYILIKLENIFKKNNTLA